MGCREMTPLWLPEGQPRAQQVDAEPLCQRALAAWQRRTGANLGWQDAEDALQHLRTAAWRSSLTYDPCRGSLANYLNSVLHWRTTEWLRQDEGRTRWQWGNGVVYEREKPLAALSLDAPVGDDTDPRTLGDMVAVRDGGDAADSPADALERADRERGRFRARDIRVLREGLSEAVQTDAA